MVATVYSRTSIYLRPPLDAFQSMTIDQGESMSGSLALMMTRYELFLAFNRPTLSVDHLSIARRIFSRWDRLMPTQMVPSILAALIEHEAHTIGDDSEIRVGYALARLASKMMQAECVAMVELCERWVRRSTRKDADKIEADIARPP